MEALETDYLVVGAGATALAFADALIEVDHEADIVLVDRRCEPGGHWNDAYPFVRLHQPAACYGVNSRPLGEDRIDEHGFNAGLYEQAGRAQLCDYFDQVLHDRLLGSGQVRFFPMSDYLGLEQPAEPTPAAVAFVAALTGTRTEVTVRRAVVDARYLEPTIPSRHQPSFAVGADVRCVPVNQLGEVREPATGYTVIGAGKTGSDACSWLLGQGVDPDDICWVRPRDPWMWNRAQVQPLDLVTDTVDGFSLGVEAAAEADSLADLFARLEGCHQLMRLDPAVTPTMYHGATITVSELEALRQIERVVRLGHVRAIGGTELELEQGTIPTDPGQLYVDCSAAGLGKAPARPIFAPGRITLQSIATVFPTFNAAMIGYLEASRGDDLTAKARLAPTTRYPEHANDWLPNEQGQLEALRLWNEQPDVAAWLEASRLNVAAGMMARAAEPRMGEALTRLLTCSEAATSNLDRLLATSA